MKLLQTSSFFVNSILKKQMKKQIKKQKLSREEAEAIVANNIYQVYNNLNGFKEKL